MKRKFKKAKKLKGMTLVEVLVALAVFSVMSLLLAESVALVCSMFTKNNHLTKKISREAPAAEWQNAPEKATEVTGGNMEVEVGGVEFTTPYKQYKIIDSENDTADFKYIK